MRRTATSTVVGRGDDAWRWAAAAVLRWGVKTAAGFTVSPPGPVSVGLRAEITVRVLGARVVEPVEVIDVVVQPARVGFTYRALPGHPVGGEETFVVHREGDLVLLTIRTLTARSRTQPWRTLYPALLVAQRVVHRRYRRAFRPPGMQPSSQPVRR